MRGLREGTGARAGYTTPFRPEEAQTQSNVGYGLRGVGDALELSEPLNVVGDDLASCAGTRGADRVGGGDERADHGHRLHVSVMADDAVDDVLREAVALEKLSADHGVRALDLMVDRLADVVEQTRALHGLRVVAGLRSEDPGDMGGLDRGAKHVLAV